VLLDVGPEDLVGEVELADLLTLQVVDGELYGAFLSS
jgi:hypothetical protein